MAVARVRKAMVVAVPRVRIAMAVAIAMLE